MDAFQGLYKIFEKVPRNVGIDVAPFPPFGVVRCVVGGESVLVRFDLNYVDFRVTRSEVCPPCYDMRGRYEIRLGQDYDNLARRTEGGDIGL